MSQITWHAAGVTDKGCRRADNQDNFYLSPDRRVFVVADGMGGERGGAVASRLAVNAVESLSSSRSPQGSEEYIYHWLEEAVSNANSHVWHKSSADPSVSGMGTTIVVAVQPDSNRLYVAHVGDSRAYIVREGKTIVLTQDHSVVMELFLQGKISEEQFRTSPFRNYITRCVGHDTQVEIDKTPVDIQAGDCVILCTDGLPAVVSDEEIAALACSASPADKQVDSAVSSSTPSTAEAICQRLIQAAIEGGAPDNVTVVAICYAAAPRKCQTN